MEDVRVEVREHPGFSAPELERLLSGISDPQPSDVFGLLKEVLYREELLEAQDRDMNRLLFMRPRAGTYDDDSDYDDILDDDDEDELVIRIPEADEDDDPPEVEDLGAMAELSGGPPRR